MKRYGVILAAGEGKRFKGEKQFFLVKKRPILFYSIFAFENSSVDEIFLVVPKKETLKIKKLIKKAGFCKVKKVVEGGKTRQESVRNGLSWLPEKGFVAIHDAARPLITSEDIDKGFKEVEKKGAVIYGVPVIDTVKEVKNKRIIKTIERKGLFLAQTPQFFKISVIKDAHRIAEEKRIQGTDDAFLCEKAGYPVFVLEGKRENIKITYPEDINIIKAFL